MGSSVTRWLRSRAVSWDDYRTAIVTVPATRARDGFVLSPAPEGAIEGPFEFPAPVHFVCAYNPGGPADAFTNARADAELFELVRHLDVEFFRSVGSDANHGGSIEPGFGLVGLERDAVLRIGRDFGQDAIYEWRVDALEILACDDAARANDTVHGWSRRPLPVD